MDSTGWRSTGRYAARSTGRLLVLVAALAGLFAMHGLSEHGVMGHDMSTMSTLAANTTDAVSAVVLEDTRVVPLANAPATAVGATSLDAGMAMALCVAILAGLVTLLLRSRGYWAALVLRRSTNSDADARLARTSREPGSPDPFVLSILRC